MLIKVEQLEAAYALEGYTLTAFDTGLRQICFQKGAEMTFHLTTNDRRVEASFALEDVERLASFGAISDAGLAKRLKERLKHILLEIPETPK